MPICGNSSRRMLCTYNLSARTDRMVLGKRVILDSVPSQQGLLSFFTDFGSIAVLK